MDKYNERLQSAATIESSQYARMDERMKRVEEKEEACQRQLTEALRRIATLEGYNEGQGDAMNDAQLYLSTERQKDAKAKEGKES